MYPAQNYLAMEVELDNSAYAIAVSLVQAMFPKKPLRVYASHLYNSMDAMLKHCWIICDAGY